MVAVVLGEAQPRVERQRRCVVRLHVEEHLLDPERALEGLWAELDARGVRPETVGADDGVTVADPWEPIDLGD